MKEKTKQLVKQAIEDVGTDPHDIALRVYDIRYCEAERRRVKRLNPEYIYKELERAGLVMVSDIKDMVQEIREGL